MQLIGLTGGIASGKSEAEKILKTECGATVIDADQIAHLLLRRSKAGYVPVLQAFGPSVLANGGEIDREKLGKVVFSDDQALRKLNAILHPLIKDELRAELAKLSKRGLNQVVVSAALIFEAKMEDWFDQILMLMVKHDIQLARLTKKRNMDRQKALSILHSQLTYDQRLNLNGCHRIENNGTLADLKGQLIGWWKQNCAA